MSSEIHACPECQAAMIWHDATMADPGRYECPTCHTKYQNVDEIKAKALERAKQAGKKVE